MKTTFRNRDKHFTVIHHNITKGRAKRMVKQARKRLDSKLILANQYGDIGLETPDLDMWYNPKTKRVLITVYK